MDGSLRAAAKRNVPQKMSGQALLRSLKDSFGVILADPPWTFKTYTESVNPHVDRRATRHYRTMTLTEIKALRVADVASPGGCHLFLWTTGPNLRQAFDVIDAWGFRYSGIAFTWVKLRKSFGEQFWIQPTTDFHVGLGFTTRKNTEFCLLARRGNARRLAKDVRELIVEPRREHSRKPDAVYGRIERYAAGPYLELFGRQERPGWTVRGDEVGKFP